MQRKIIKILSLLLCFCLVFEQAGFAQGGAELNIAGYFAALRNSLAQDKFRPLHLRYLAYDSLHNNFKLLLDRGDLKNPRTQELEHSTKILLNYFFIGISLPNDSFWVNLRPDSPDNIIDPLLEQTDLGRVLLEADLQLKKDTSIATSPQTPQGKEYWDKLYKKAGELFGSENISIPTLTRPWIVPDEIIIRESVDNAYIYKATLKVMLEQDYLKGSAEYSFKDGRLKALNEYSSQLIRELIIPKLTKEVNTAKRYAPLRQVYYSLILAQWFKQKFAGKEGRYSGLIDQKNLTGLTSKEPYSVNTYFTQYKKSFAEGEYNIKEPVATAFGQVIRSYMSGGIVLAGSPITEAIEAGGRIAGNPLRSIANIINPEAMISVKFDANLGQMRIATDTAASPVKGQVVPASSSLTMLSVGQTIINPDTGTRRVILERYSLNGAIALTLTRIDKDGAISRENRISEKDLIEKIQRGYYQLKEGQTHKPSFLQRLLNSLRKQEPIQRPELRIGEQIALPAPAGWSTRRQTGNDLLRQAIEKQNKTGLEINWMGHATGTRDIETAKQILTSGKLIHRKGEIQYVSLAERATGFDDWDTGTGLFILDPNITSPFVRIADKDASGGYRNEVSLDKIKFIVFDEQYAYYMRNEFPRYAEKIFSYGELAKKLPQYYTAASPVPNKVSSPLAKNESASMQRLSVIMPEPQARKAVVGVLEEIKKKRGEITGDATTGFNNAFVELFVHELMYGQLDIGTYRNSMLRAFDKHTEMFLHRVEPSPAQRASIALSEHIVNAYLGSMGITPNVTEIVFVPIEYGHKVSYSALLNKIFISVDNIGESLEWSLVHEAFHANSSGFGAVALNEGATEYLTMVLFTRIKKPFINFPIDQLLKSYDELAEIKEHEIGLAPLYAIELGAMMTLVETVGEEALVEAYFRGRMELLEKRLGQSLWQEITDYAHSVDLGYAQFNTGIISEGQYTDIIVAYGAKMNEFLARAHITAPVEAVDGSAASPIHSETALPSDSDKLAGAVASWLSADNQVLDKRAFLRDLHINIWEQVFTFQDYTRNIAVTKNLRIPDNIDWVRFSEDVWVKARLGNDTLRKTAEKAIAQQREQLQGIDQLNGLPAGTVLEAALPQEFFGSAIDPLRLIGDSAGAAQLQLSNKAELENQLARYIELPAHRLVKEILEIRGMPYSSNAYGYGYKGVFWTKDGIHYFTPLTETDYNHEVLMSERLRPDSPGTVISNSGKEQEEEDRDSSSAGSPMEQGQAGSSPITAQEKEELEFYQDKCAGLILQLNDRDYLITTNWRPGFDSLRMAGLWRTCSDIRTTLEAAREIAIDYLELKDIKNPAMLYAFIRTHSDIINADKLIRIIERYRRGEAPIDYVIGEQGTALEGLRAKVIELFEKKLFEIGRQIGKHGHDIAGGVSRGRSNTREIIRVDWNKDIALNTLYRTIIDEAGISNKDGLLNGEEKKEVLERIYNTVAKRVVFDEERIAALERKFRNQEVLLGEAVIDKGGVCRHHGILSAALLERFIQEGYLFGKCYYFRGPGHGWAVYRTSAGEFVVFDIAQHYLGPIEGATYLGSDYRRYPYGEAVPQEILDEATPGGLRHPAEFTIVPNNNLQKRASPSLTTEEKRQQNELAVYAEKCPGLIYQGSDNNYWVIDNWSPGIEDSGKAPLIFRTHDIREALERARLNAMPYLKISDIITPAMLYAFVAANNPSPDTTDHIIRMIKEFFEDKKGSDYVTRGRGTPLEGLRAKAIELKTQFASPAPQAQAGSSPMAGNGLRFESPEQALKEGRDLLEGGKKQEAVERLGRAVSLYQEYLRKYMGSTERRALEEGLESAKRLLRQATASSALQKDLVPGLVEKIKTLIDEAKGDELIREGLESSVAEEIVTALAWDGPELLSGKTAADMLNEIMTDSVDGGRVNHIQEFIDTRGFDNDFQRHMDDLKALMGLRQALRKAGVRLDKYRAINNVLIGIERLVRKNDASSAIEGDVIGLTLAEQSETSEVRLKRLIGLLEDLKGNLELLKDRENITAGNLREPYKAIRTIAFEINKIQTIDTKLKPIMRSIAKLDFERKEFDVDLPNQLGGLNGLVDLMDIGITVTNPEIKNALAGGLAKISKALGILNYVMGIGIDNVPLIQRHIDDRDVESLDLRVVSERIEHKSPGSNSSPVAKTQDSKGGIDLRGLPIMTQPQAVSSPVLGAPQLGLGQAVPFAQLSREWQEIERMLEAGIIPSTERIREACCQQKGIDIDKVLACLAAILRLEEERVAATEPGLKEMLALLESDKSTQELQVALSTIIVPEKEPELN